MTFERDQQARNLLLKWIEENGPVTSREAGMKIQRSQGTAHHILNSLVAEGRLAREIPPDGPTRWRRVSIEEACPLATAMQGWGR